MPAPLAIVFFLPVVLALLWFGGAWIYGGEGRIARGVVLRFLLTIAGLFVATGWLTTSVLAEQGKSRLKAECTREHHDHIYDTILQEIDVLPRQTIDTVVTNCSQIKAIAALAEDMRGEQFQELAQERRVLMYQDYVGMRKQAFAYGQHALKLITAYSDGGSTAAQMVIAKINNPDGGQTGPSQGLA